MTATGLYIASNYVVVPAQSMKMHNFVYASDCLHRRCQSDQITSVNDKKDDIVILLPSSSCSSVNLASSLGLRLRWCHLQPGWPIPFDSFFFSSGSMLHGLHMYEHIRNKYSQNMLAMPSCRAVQSVLTSFPCLDVCVLGALMHELEAILHEYLSFNWDRMEEVNTANAPLQRKEGLACPWRPSKDIQHSVSTATYRNSSR